MSQRRDYYEVLGLARDADGRTIKAAYRKLALQYHPDRNPGDATAEDKFKEAAEAYEVLSDPNKRAVYDRHGFDGLRGSGFSGFGNQDVGDIFAHFGDLFADFFGGGGFGGFGRGGPRPMVGHDLRSDVEITLEEAATGIEKEIEVHRTKACLDCQGTGAERAELSTCAACGGSGQIVSGRGGFMIATTCRACGGAGRLAKAPCPTCSGRGRTDDKRTLQVPIPPGVRSGLKLRLQGQGDAGINGGPPGDLYVVIQVEDHELFARDGADLHCELHLPFPMAVNGGKATVPRLTKSEETGEAEDIEVKVPAGTQPGDTLRIKDEGLPELGGRGRGDLIVHLNVRVPKDPDEPQKKALEQLAKVFPETPEVTALGAKRSERRRRGGRASFFDRLRDAFEVD